MMKKLISFLLYSVAIFLIICLFITAVLSYLFRDIKQYTEVAIHPIEKKTGLDIAVGEVHWNFFRGIGITLDNLHISHTKSNTPFLYCKKFYVRIKLLPLLKRQIVASTVLVDKPQISLYRNKQGQWLFLSPVAPPEGNSSPRWFNVASSITSCKKVILHNGSLKLNDRFYNHTAFFENIYATIETSQKAKNINALFSATQKSDKKQGVLSFKAELVYQSTGSRFSWSTADCMVKLQSINPASFAPYIKQWTSIADIRGPLDANISLSIRPDANFKVKGWIESKKILIYSLSPKPVIFPESLLQMSLKGNRNTLLCDNFSFSTAGVTLKGNANITGLQSHLPIVGLKLSSNTIQWETIKQIAPAENFPPAIQNYYQAVQNGSLTLSHLHLKGIFSGVRLKTLKTLQAEGKIDNLTISPFKNMLPLRITNGLFKLDDDCFSFRNLTANWLARDKHIIKGKIISLFDKPSLNLSIQSTIPSDILGVLVYSLIAEKGPGDFIKNISFTQGVTTIHTAVNYILPEKRLETFSSTINLTHLSYIVAEIVSKPAGLKNQLTIKGIAQEGRQLSSVTIHYLLGDKSLLFTGVLNNWSLPEFSGHYKLSNMDIQLLPILSLSPDITIEGRINSYGTFHFPVTMLHEGSMKGSLEIHDFRIIKRNEPNPLLSFTLFSTINNQIITINRCNGILGETVFNIHGKIHGWKIPQGSFQCDASFLDLDNLILTIKKLRDLKARREEQKLPAQKNFFRRALISANITALQGNFLKWNFRNGNCQLHIRSGVMFFDGIKLSAYRGTISGNVIYSFAQPGVYQLTLLPSAKGVEVSEFFPELKKCKIISGRMDLNGNFTSLFTKSQEIAPSMNGDFVIDIKDGKLGKFSTISKILSLLDLSQIIKLKLPDLFAKGMPLNSVKGHFAMKNAVANTEDLLLESPAMRLSTVGDIDFLNKEIDFIVGVQILKTIAQLIGSIPVAGNILIGDKKTFTVSYFHVKGPYTDPEVKSMQIESMGKGIINIFKRIFLLPQEILEPLNNHNKTRKK